MHVLLFFRKYMDVITYEMKSVMSAELKKDMVEEAMTKGACFFLKKPISSKNLKNVWQHVCRNNKNEKSKAEIEQEAKVHEKENVLRIVDEGTSPGTENEQIGDSDEKDIGGGDEKRLTKTTEISKKMSVVPENDEAGKLKRKRREEEEGIKSSKEISRLSGESSEFHMQVDSTTFVKLLQETDTVNGSNLSEDLHLQTKFSMRKKQKMDLVKESGSSTSCVGEKE